MPDTVRTLAAIQALLADNASGDIGAQDVRDHLVSAWTPDHVRYLHHRLPAETPHTDDDFFDADSSADYTTQTVSGTAVWAQAGGRLACTFASQASLDTSAYLKAITVASAPMTIETKLYFAAPVVDNPGAGILFTDGTAVGSNMCGLALSGGAGSASFNLREGTLTSYADGTLSIWGGAPLGFYEVYLRVIWESANVFSAAISFDGNQWYDRGATTLAQTLTPTHIGFWVAAETNATQHQAVFGPIRVYDADLSV